MMDRSVGEITNTDEKETPPILFGVKLKTDQSDPTESACLSEVV